MAELIATGVTEGLDTCDTHTRTMEHVQSNAISEQIIENIPEEMQLEEVDMDDPKMDPLERSVRRIIPIPKKYYWENENDTNIELPVKVKVWHNTVAILGNITRFAEKIGEVAADTIGLTASRYSYVTDTMTEEQWEDARMVADERKSQRELKQAEQDAAKDAGLAQDAI
mmetsp:Transcript_14688/g.17877  ORF Transcript_14688/g.17877 Transcript_14688/m.17877 type:complete len:170 (+) Transcript_14688:75-584(+)